jgi:hypothetical protein
MQYFMVLPGDWYRQLLVPALQECWLRRNFLPAEAICRELSAVAREFVQNDASELPVSLQVVSGLQFRPEYWKLLVGELLLFGAAELPELETPLRSYAAVMHQHLSDSRYSFQPIQQAVQGSRDIRFGTYYRPEHAGWNDETDVLRLATQLAAIDPTKWVSDDLAGEGVEDRDDELAFLREWFPRLTETYQRAADLNRVIVCEEM